MWVLWGVKPGGSSPSSAPSEVPWAALCFACRLMEVNRASVAFALLERALGLSIKEDSAQSAPASTVVGIDQSSGISCNTVNDHTR
jgi:hypothetical protein